MQATYRRWAYGTPGERASPPDRLFSNTIVEVGRRLVMRHLSLAGNLQHLLLGQKNDGSEKLATVRRRLATKNPSKKNVD